MNADQVKQAVEDFLTDAEIPLRHYKIIVVKDNGTSHLVIKRSDNKPIIEMYQFSEVISGYSDNWKVEVDSNGVINIVVY